MAEREGFEPPCRLPGKTLSRRPRYDHFGTSPCLALAPFGARLSSLRSLALRGSLRCVRPVWRSRFSALAYAHFAARPARLAPLRSPCLALAVLGACLRSLRLLALRGSLRCVRPVWRSRLSALAYAHFARSPCASRGQTLPSSVRRRSAKNA